MPRRKLGEELERITVWPRAASDELGSIVPPESGLSVEPEEIGAQFLSNATEQGLSDWPEAADDEGDYPGADGDGEDGGGFDEAAFELDPRGWERRITRSLRLGTFRPPPAPRTGTMRMLPDDSAREDHLGHALDEIDLCDEAIQEASLLDHEGDELGEVESPQLRTDDTHTHGRRRGGHGPSPKRKRRNAG
jgi:hypothetical protein